MLRQIYDQMPEPEVGAGDGRLRQQRRHVQQLRDRAGRRPRRARRHVPARLPAAAGDAASTRSSSCTSRSRPPSSACQPRQPRSRSTRAPRSTRRADLGDEGAAAVSDERQARPTRAAARSRRAGERRPSRQAEPTRRSGGRRRPARHVRRRAAPATPPATAAWSARSRCPAATAAPVRRLVRRGGRRGWTPRCPTTAPGVRGARSRRSSCTAARSPSTSAATHLLERRAQPLRDDPALRFEFCSAASAACTTRTTPGASCTRSTTCCR